MFTQKRQRLHRLVVAAATIAGFCLGRPAAAQDRPAPAVEGAAGVLFFADDGIPTEGFGGGALRIYATPRLSVGPEVSFVSGEHHSHLLLTGNVTFDLLGSRNGAPPPVTPFVTAGVGVFQTRESFPFSEDFTSYDPAFTAGGGVRVRIGPRVFVGTEARIGWELHIRLNGLVGVQLGR